MYLSRQHRFLFQNKEIPHQATSPEADPSFEAYTFLSEEEREKEANNYSFSMMSNETPEMIHYKLRGGYEVKEGDALISIVKNVFQQKVDYGMEVEYRSDKIEESKKPKTLIETDKIYPGQYIVLTGSKIIISDIPIDPTEFNMPLLMNMILPEEDGGEEEGGEEEQEKKSLFYGSSDVSDVQFMDIQNESDQLSAVESVFANQGKEAPKEVIEFISDNGLDINPQQVYVNSEGFAAFPFRKNAIGGGEIVFSVFVDKNGKTQMCDENSKGIRKAESLQEAYDLAVYNEILDYEFRIINRGKNKGVENINRYLQDEDLKIIVEELDVMGDSDMHPVSNHSQRVMRKFAKDWIYKANKEAYVRGGEIPISKMMKQLVSKDENIQGTVQREKIRNMTRDLFLRNEKSEKQ